MKVFLVKAESFTYDDYDSVVLVAESKERALEMAKESTWETYEKEKRFYFGERQYPLTADEIDLTKEDSILGSFNAG
jgi:hypothetical protein